MRIHKVEINFRDELAVDEHPGLGISIAISFDRLFEFPLHLQSLRKVKSQPTLIIFLSPPTVFT
jgi:hypothetical protein